VRSAGTAEAPALDETAAINEAAALPSVCSTRAPFEEWDVP
jgi:hypothetical protein